MRLARLLAPAAAALVAASALVGCGDTDATSPARYGLTMDMRSMAPHVGQMLELRIVHVDTMHEVAYTKVDPIVAANFLVTVPDCLILGEHYYVDFYADLNRNHRYNAPPVDHAWRREIGSVAGATTLTFTHNLVWTDIEFPPHG